MIMMMDMPIRSLLGISTPIINESIKNNDWDNIEKLYKKSSIVLLVVSIIILAVLWCNIDAIFAIMPKGGEFKAAKYLLLILGVSKLIDAITSINSVILNFSKHYKYSLILTLILGLFTVLTAYLLIPTYGLIGAAFSTAISMAIFQILLTTFVFIIYKKHPFTLATFKVLASFGIMICVVYFLPDINPFLTIAYKTLLIAIFSYLFIFRLRLSNVVYEEISSSINSQYPALKFLL
jgi:O-antigen/teichoic acid export membrane protein